MWAKHAELSLPLLLFKSHPSCCGCGGPTNIFPSNSSWCSVDMFFLLLVREGWLGVAFDPNGFATPSSSPSEPLESELLESEELLSPKESVRTLKAAGTSASTPGSAIREDMPSISATWPKALSLRLESFSEESHSSGAGGTAAVARRPPAMSAPPGIWAVSSV